jgi:hypothetical protein
LAKAQSSQAEVQREIVKLFVLAESKDSWEYFLSLPAVLILRLKSLQEAKNLAGQKSSA